MKKLFFQKIATILNEDIFIKLIYPKRILMLVLVKDIPRKSLHITYFDNKVNLNDNILYLNEYNERKYF